MTDTAIQNLTAALPANPEHDECIGVNGRDLRSLLGRLVDVTGLCETEPTYVLGEGAE